MKTNLYTNGKLNFRTMEMIVLYIKIIMKNLLFIGFFLAGFLNRVEANQLAIQAMLDRNDATEIRRKIVDGVPLEKPTPISVYHVTVGLIDNVAEQHVEPIIAHLNCVVPSNLGVLELGDAFQFIPGTMENPTWFVIRAANIEHFQELNRVYARALQSFNMEKGNGTNYIFNAHTSTNYVPHLSVGKSVPEAIPLLQEKLNFYKNNENKNYEAKIGFMKVIKVSKR